LCFRKKSETTHSGINSIVAFEVGILSSAMMGLAKCYAGDTTSDGTCVDYQ
jgi:hypothetical protein